MSEISLALPEQQFSPAQSKPGTQQSFSRFLPSPTASLPQPVPQPPHSTIPRLDDLVLRHIAHNHKRYPIIDYLPLSSVHAMAPLLPPPSGTIDLIVALSYIESEVYWQRMCLARWTAEADTNFFDTITAAPHTHALTWRQYYCERHCQERIEAWADGGESLEQFQRELTACAPYVQSIALSKFPSHSHLDTFLAPLAHLSAFRGRFGCQSLKLDYNKELLGIKINDIIALSSVLANTLSLTKVILSENFITDEMIELLMLSLSDNSTVTWLDVSHNNITDKGAECLARLIHDVNQPSKPSFLIHLNLSDNKISHGGAKALAKALSNNQYTEMLLGSKLSVSDISYSLLTLNLSLNALAVDGVDELLRAINHGGRVVSLELVGVGMTSENLPALIECIEKNTPASSRTSNYRHLGELKLACNSIVSKKAADTASALDANVLLSRLYTAIQSNSQLTVFDLTHCGFDGLDKLSEIKKLLFARLEEIQQRKRKSVENSSRKLC